MLNRIIPTYVYVIFISAIIFFGRNSYAEKYIEPDVKVLDQQKKIIQEAFKKLESPEVKKEIDEALGTEIKSANSMNVTSTTNSIKLPNAKGLDADDWRTVENSASSAQARVESGAQREKYPIIFVSFSMPEEQIKALIEEASHFGAAVVIRGLIKDDFKKTVSKLQQIAGTEEKANGILIDPTLFKMFDVSMVPSFVIPLTEFDACTPDACVPPQFVKMSGSATLAYVLDLVSRTGSPQEKQEANYWLSQKIAK